MNTLRYEKEKYEELYTKVPGYNSSSPAERLYPLILGSLRQLGSKKILDAGCGKGQIIAKLVKEGYDVTGVDLTLSGIKDKSILEHCIESPLSALPFDDDTFDYVICVDVLEHIPKADNLLNDSLKEMSRVSEYCLFKIALFKDNFGKMIGKTLHETIMPAPKWVALLNRYFDKVQMLEDLGGNITVLCVK